MTTFAYKAACFVPQIGAKFAPNAEQNPKHKSAKSRSSGNGMHFGRLVPNFLPPPHKLH